MLELRGEIDKILEKSVFVGTFRTKDGQQITMDKSIRQSMAEELMQAILALIPEKTEHPKGQNGCHYWDYIQISEGKAERMCNCGASSHNDLVDEMHRIMEGEK